MFKWEMNSDRIVFRDEQRRKKECSIGSAPALDPDHLTAFRKPAAIRNASNNRGHYFFSKTEKHVVFESKLECDNLTLLDFDPEIATVLGQPFQTWVDGHPHVPDFFAALIDGSRHVFDVKRAEEAAEEKNQAIFARTRDLCERVGWGYTVLHEPANPVLFENVRWLAGYRGVPHGDPALTERILTAAEPRCTVESLVNAIDELPVLVRPVIFHLLWRHDLEADLETELLDEGTQLWRREVEHGA